jgi:hypothetical protein
MNLKSLLSLYIIVNFVVLLVCYMKYTVQLKNLFGLLTFFADR